MNLQVIETGAFGANCYILWEDCQHALVIDPGADAEVILQVLREHTCVPCGYLLTHGHLDHISALPELLSVYPAPVYLHERDAQWAFTQQNCIPPYRPVLTVPAGLVQALPEGFVIQAGTLTVRVYQTPGHTPGGVCYCVEEAHVLFSGDTLFQGSIGRTDFPGGDWNTMQQSLQKLMALPQNYRVYPGHGCATDCETERAENPFILEMGLARKATK